MFLTSLPSHVLNSILYHVQGMFLHVLSKDLHGGIRKAHYKFSHHHAASYNLNPYAVCFSYPFLQKPFQTTYKFPPPLFSHKIIIFSSICLSTRYQIRNFIFRPSRVLDRMEQKRRKFPWVNEVYFFRQRIIRAEVVTILSSLMKSRLQSQTLHICGSDCRRKCLYEALMFP